MTRSLTPTSEKPHRDFLQIPDLSAKEIEHLFVLAEKMRAGKYKKKPLAGKSLAMIFMKSSTRTRVSFEVGTSQLGGHALFLSPRDVQLGRAEPIADTALGLSARGGPARSPPPAAAPPRSSSPPATSSSAAASRSPTPPACCRATWTAS